MNYHQPLTFLNVSKFYDRALFAEIMGFGQFEMPFKAFIQNKSFVMQCFEHVHDYSQPI